MLVCWLNLNQPRLETLANLVSISKACSHFLFPSKSDFYSQICRGSEQRLVWLVNGFKKASVGALARRMRYRRCRLGRTALLFAAGFNAGLCESDCKPLTVATTHGSCTKIYLAHAHAHKHAHTGHQAMNSFARVKQKVLRLYNLESQSTNPVLQKSCW